MNKADFYETLRKKLKGLTTKQVEGFETVLDAAEGAPLSHQAYMLATAYWETNETMQPVIEAYWLSEAWRKRTCAITLGTVADMSSLRGSSITKKPTRNCSCMAS